MKLIPLRRFIVGVSNSSMEQLEEEFGITEDTAPLGVLKYRIIVDYTKLLSLKVTINMFIKDEKSTEIFFEGFDFINLEDSKFDAAIVKEGVFHVFWRRRDTGEWVTSRGIEYVEDLAKFGLGYKIINQNGIAGI